MNTLPTLKRSALLYVVVLCLLLGSCSHNSGGQARTSAASPESYEWTQVTASAGFPVGYNFPVYVVGDKMIALHFEGTWESKDGKTWTRSALPSIRGDVYKTRFVQFKNAIYALGDNSGNYEKMAFSSRIRRTTDLRKWEDVAKTSNLPNRIFYASFVFNDKIWILGGYDGPDYFNDIWNSSDGKTWNRVVTNAAWSPRTAGTVVVFKNKIFLIGGGTIDGTPNPNPESGKEIWSSVDGIRWTRVAHDLQNGSGGSPIVFDDKIWLVGANRDGSFARSSLVSDDGEVWREVAAPWSPRGGVATWIFNDRLYVTGGKYSVTENGQIRFIYSNDVWMMTKK